VDQHDLAGAEEPLADRQRADRVVGDGAAGVTDDVRVALCQPEQLRDVHASVHARQNCELAGGRERQLPIESVRVRVVVLQKLVDDRHDVLLPGMSVRRSY
jgi:hypothetical protein